jgi:hypothetical protein
MDFLLRIVLKRGMAGLGPLGLVSDHLRGVLTLTKVKAQLEVYTRVTNHQVLALKRRLRRKRRRK